MGSAPPMVEPNANDLPQHTTKRCCDCNCDCGHSLVNTFSDIVNEKVAPLYEMLHRVENLLISVVSIKYPELKRKMGTNPPVASELAPPDPNDDEYPFFHPNFEQVFCVVNITAPITTPNPCLDTHRDDTPKKRRRIYSHHISVCKRTTTLTSV